MSDFGLSIRTVTSVEGVSTDQMIQLAKAVGLEVTWTSYGLLEDLLLCARSVDTLKVRGQPSRLPFPSVVRSVVGDSVATQLRFSVLNVSGFTGTAANEDAVQTVEIQSFIVAGNVVGQDQRICLVPHWVRAMCH